ncbi:unnamed protein product [Dibothriocephalus latus]|uniref:Uncharacterized protein n=1 Tax=Dibothriocephalus latus TaxID=60516 RepID=A0A3P7LCQ2_DIBLA|nr:unnamed protein product [Dibothriocephalus latus]
MSILSSYHYHYHCDSTARISQAIQERRPMWFSFVRLTNVVLLPSTRRRNPSGGVGDEENPRPGSTQFVKTWKRFMALQFLFSVAGDKNAWRFPDPPQLPIVTRDIIKVG